METKKRPLTHVAQLQLLEQCVQLPCVGPTDLLSLQDHLSQQQQEAPCFAIKVKSPEAMDEGMTQG